MPDYLREYYDENGSRKISPDNFMTPGKGDVKITDELLISPRTLTPIKESKSFRKKESNNKNKIDIRAPKMEIVGKYRRNF
tara:strand:- start:474 stop:716 length:243 start_codon:yes stop_codon:yes gene_type:complete